MQREVKEHSVAYIKECLEKKGGSISFKDEDDEPYGGTFVCITYDGGNHPEYAANPYSDVQGIYMKGDEVLVHCEDSDEVILKYLSWDEIFSIAEYIYDFIKID